MFIDSAFGKISPTGLKIAICVKTVDASRNWPAEKFSELINKVINEYNAYFIIVGVSSDMDVVRALEIDNAEHIINLVGKTNLRQLNALFNAVDFLINFDNGMGHFAAAAGCPTVTMFTNGDPVQFKPMHDKTLVLKSSYKCLYACDKKNKRTCGFKCVNDITVNEVFNKIHQFLQTRRSVKT